MRKTLVGAALVAALSPAHRLPQRHRISLRTSAPSASLRLEESSKWECPGPGPVCPRPVYPLQFRQSQRIQLHLGRRLP